MLFLSHSGADSAAAKDLARRLREAGLEVWLDLDHLQPGDPWMAKLEEALQQASAFAVYVGSSGIQRWVDREVRVALERSTADPSFRIIPILGDSAADPQTLPFFLRQHQAVDFRRETSPAELKRLIGAILARPAEAVSLLPPGTPPFRGLEYFDVEHAHLFFGRDADMQELLEKLRADRFLAVVGASGSGKSSLVRAGLIPMLHRGRFQDGGSWPASWRIAICRPGNRPLRALASALPDLDPEMPPAERIRTIGECARQLEQGTEGLEACVAALVPRGNRTLLLVDQFEEVFTLTSAPEERRHFINTLLGITESAGDRPVHVLITLRADFYSRCWEHPELPGRIAQNQHAARPLQRAQLREVIEKPLAMAGASFESGLVDRILNEAGDEPGSLPLVEHALLQLWERRQGKVLTHAAYEEIGGVSGALAHHADEVFARLSEDERQIAQKIFLRLTHPGEGTEDTRRRAGRDEIVALGGDEEVAERVLTILAAADARLVVTRREGEGNVVEVAHEALIREWMRLREWIAANRAAIRIERRLIAAAAEWVHADKDPDAVLRGAQLVETQEWAQQHLDDLRPQEQEFLEASIEARDRAIREAEERRQRELAMARQVADEAAARAEAERHSAEVAVRAARRNRQFAGGLALVAMAAVGIALFAWFMWGEADRQTADAQSRALAATSEATFARDPTEALLLAIRAVNMAPTFEAVAALRQSLRLPTVHAVLRGHEGEVWAASFDSDGRRVVTASEDGTARVWDLQSGEATDTLRGHEGAVLAASFDSDGRRVVTGGSDRTARVWDLQSGEARVLRGHEGRVGAASFDSDGRRVVTASEDGTARVWDLQSGEATDVLRGHEGRVWAASFNSDGTRVVTGGPDRTARLFLTNVDDLLEIARSRIPVTLAPAVRDTLLGNVSRKGALFPRG
ncbi:MAG: TIR domain-containing protein [Gemmatimonadetes bacterium]|nr:TIR domain-containing protein [Gemmatimonadota bacterium]